MVLAKSIDRTKAMKRVTGPAFAHSTPIPIATRWVKKISHRPIE